MKLDFKILQERLGGIGIGVFATNQVEKYLVDMARDNNQVKEYLPEIMAILGIALPELINMGKNNALVENASDALLAKGLEKALIKYNVVEPIAGVNGEFILGCGCNHEYVAGDNSQYYSYRDEKTGGYAILKDNGDEIPDLVYYLPSEEQKKLFKEAILKNMQAQQLNQNGEIVRPQDLGMSQMDMPAQFVKYPVKEAPEVAGNINKNNLI